MPNDFIRLEDKKHSGYMNGDMNSTHQIDHAFKYQYNSNDR